MVVFSRPESFFQRGKDLLGCLDFSKFVKKFEDLRTKQPSSHESAVLKSLELPQIVIIGSENAGKSSTLERILGVEVLPRAPDFCTRIAVKIKLLHDPTCAKPRLNLVLPELGVFKGGPRYKTFANITAKDVALKLEQLNKEIKSRKLGIVVDRSATLERTSNDVPSLILVDLPGVIAVRLLSDDEPHKLAEMTEELTRNFLNQAETGGVLCIVDATIDTLKSSKAIRILQDCRPDLQPNAVVVMTKPDKSYDPTWQDEDKNGPLWLLEDRLLGKSTDYISVHGGYVALKNRSTESKKQLGFYGQNEDEMQWFSKNCSSNSGFFSTVKTADDGDEVRSDEKAAKRMKIEGNRSDGENCKQLSDLGSRHLGVLALIKKLDWIITQFLNKDWIPAKLAEQEEEVARIHKELAPFGLSPEDVGLERLKNCSSEMLIRALEPRLVDELCTASFEGFTTSTVSSPSLWEAVTRSHALLQAYRDAIDSDFIIQYVGKRIESLIASSFAADKTEMINLGRFETLKAMLLSEMWLLMQDKVHLDAFKKNAHDCCNVFLNNGFSFKKISGWTFEFNTLRMNLCECIMIHLLLPMLHKTKGIVPSTFNKLDKVPPETADMAALRADLQHQLENVELIKKTLRNLTECI